MRHISHLIEVGDPIHTLDPPYKFLTSAVEYEELCPSRFGFGVEGRPYHCASPLWHFPPRQIPRCPEYLSSCSP